MNVIDTYKFVWKELKKYNRTKVHEKRVDKRIVIDQRIYEFWNSNEKYIIIKNCLDSLKKRMYILKENIIFRIKLFPIHYTFLGILILYFTYIFGHNILPQRIYKWIDLLLDKSNTCKVLFVVIYVISAIIVLYSRPSETIVHLNKVREKIVLLSNVKKEMSKFEKLRVYALLITMKICDCDIDHIKQETHRFKDVNLIKVVLNIIKWVMGILISALPIGDTIGQLIIEDSGAIIEGYILIIMISAIVCLMLIVARLSLIIKKDIYKSSIDYVVDYYSSSVYNKMEFTEEELNKYYNIVFKYYFGQ